MFASLFSTFSVLVRLAFAIPVLIILLRLYARTQMKAFLWLIASLVAWPLLAVGTSMVMPSLFRHLSATGGYASPSIMALYSVVFLAEAFLGGGLLLVSIIMLERELTARMDPYPPLRHPNLSSNDHALPACLPRRARYPHDPLIVISSGFVFWNFRRIAAMRAAGFRPSTWAYAQLALWCIALAFWLYTGWRDWTRVASAKFP